jgi:small subunit ribosomal protein S3
MGQKINPLGFRIAITEPWRSRWYAHKKEFSRFLLEDQQIRKYVLKNCTDISKVEIERTGEAVTVYLHTASPGLLIGKKGSKVDKLREDLERTTGGKPVRLKIQEVHRRELESVLVANDVAQQLEKRASFRRTLKKAIDTSMAAGAKGVKIRIAGRLGGAEMARVETQKRGQVPLNTLCAQLDYGTSTAQTTYGVIGVKVWIFKGKLAPGETTCGLLSIPSKR